MSPNYEPKPDTEGMKVTTTKRSSGWLRDPRYDRMRYIDKKPRKKGGLSVPDSVNLIAAECDRIKAMLIEKNLSYGNSALEPIRVLSKADATEQLKVRIDDKLNRLKNDGDSLGEDTVQDLIGYLVLLRIAMRRT